MVSIDLPDETYRALQNFMDKLRPHASRYGNVVTEVGAIDEALAIAEEMWSDESYVKARLEMPSKELKKEKKDFRKSQR